MVSLLPWRWALQGLPGLERRPQKPVPIAGAQLRPWNTRRELYQHVGNFVGSVCSPLMSNVYLHQLDLYWWHHYGGLHRKAKERRRQVSQGNGALIRYADDWVRHEARIVHGASAPTADQRAVSLSP